MANPSRPGERNLVDVHVSCDRLARRRAVAREQVDHPRRIAGLLDQIGDHERRERGLLGRLQDDGAAGGKHRCELPGQHEEGEVPRNDLAHHAHRLALGEHEKASVLHRDGLARNLVGMPGVISEALDNERDVDVLRDGDRLAVVITFDLGELGGVTFNQIRKLIEQISSRDPRQARECGERTACGCK